MLTAKNVAVLVYDQVDALDVTGPFDVFAVASNWGQDFRVYTVALESTAPIRTISGLTIVPDFTVSDCPDPYILIVPGGWGSRKEMHNQTLTDWINTASRRAAFTLSVCTGALLLAKAGLLEGMRATTNRRAMDLLLEAAPASATLVENVRYVDNGRLITSAGVTAGIDAALHLVAKLHGEERALETASRLEHDWRREPSEMLAIRRATDVDVYGIRSLLIGAAHWIHATHGFWQWKEQYFERVDIEAFVREHEVFVALLRDEIVGCFSVQWEDKEIWGELYHEDAGYVHRLCTARSRTGEGIGNELIRYAENYICAQGKSWIRLDCMADNPSLNAYYVNSGFTHCGRFDVNVWSVNLYEREIGKTPAR
ncbi:acetyltransferase (GNAT) family protein [Paenibacillus taihuensis]|uniref:Acetyltransferase (GNAT) family protein n=1 Tax=Paenibacillus taihuensis TaxID=1156355 RepID=A0A3D9QWM1_9BACL|nr:GNAT family N-acetyltransferase [Paenibacillus taihuensis]REE69624.1 acetyltransferase (GNAT) family protein [Paenibacillus taihuensis]